MKQILIVNKISRTSWMIPFYLIAIMLTSCEGFKILRIYNQTGSEIIIQTKPKLPTSIPTTHEELADVGEYRIPQDSSLTVLSTFGALLFKLRIKEKELPIDYLRIITAKDTITANSREEILKLVKNEKTRYTNKNDLSRLIDNNKNFEVIVVRE